MPIIQRRPINKMLDTMRAKANECWPAMYNTHAYKHIMSVLAKSDEDITYVDKEMMSNNLHLLAMCLGLPYYILLQEAYQE